MNVFVARRAWLLCLLALLLHASVTTAAPTAQFWEELGGSASGLGISASVRGVVPEHRNVSVAIGPDGQPVIAYTDWDAIVVKRWTGTEWELVGVPGGGHVPQIAFDSRGRMVVGWLHFVPTTQSWEAYLVVRQPGGADWEALGGSDSGGGISGAAGPTNSNTMAMALAPDGTPYVAYDTTPTSGADFGRVSSGIAANRAQIYVKRWAGPAQGWVFVGSGREGGGASNARSFRYTVGTATGTSGLALHGAVGPTIAVGTDGRPVVAFIYTSSFEGGANPLTFNGLNDDIYVTRWDGTAWVAVGPAVPAGPDAAGLGGPGGASNSDGWSLRPWLDLINSPVITVGADNRPVVAWGETGADDLTRVFVRRWTGAAWTGIGVGNGLVDTAPTANDVSITLGPVGPLVTWGHGTGAASSVFVRAWDGGSWVELGAGSATGTGISGPAAHGFTPAIALDRAGTPTVVWVDALGTEASGQTFVRTFDARLMPDLTVTTITAPLAVRQGQTISVSSTVRNAGGAVSPAMPLRFYLTTGTEPGAGDVLLGSRTVGALAINGASTAATSLVIPATVAPGTYRILAVVDPNGAITERNESNNFRVSGSMAVTLYRPDLTLIALKTPATAQTGRPLVITHTVRNVGLAPASASVMTFFIVSDATADSVLLGTRALGALGSGATSTLTTSLTIPATLPVPAAYRVMAVLDSAQQQTELDESNNTLTTSSIAVTAYRPDLTVTNITLPATAQAGRPLAIRHTVRNAGPAPAGAFAVRFFLSADDVLDAGDVLLGARSIGALAAGASSTAITTLTLPGNTSVPGTYRVIALVDALGQAIELDETNNAAVSSPVPVTAYRPDLTISALTVPATARAGRPLAITHTIRNLGPAPAGAFVIRFYLASGDVLDPGDVLLGTRRVAALGAGASSAAITSVTVPVTTAVPVSYRVIAVADALEQQVELDESNNVTTSAPLALTAYRPEILITAIGAPAVAQAGRPMLISHTVRNAGPAPAGPFVIRFFLSADDRADAGDVLLGTRVVGGLGAGLSSAANMNMVVPVTVAAGAYRIVAVADAAGQQAELDETNDVAVSTPLTVAR